MLIAKNITPYYNSYSKTENQNVALKNNEFNSMSLDHKTFEYVETIIMYKKIQKDIYIHL